MYSHAVPEWVGQLLELLVLALLAYERRRAGHDLASTAEAVQRVERVSKVTIDSLRPPPPDELGRCPHIQPYELPHTVPAVDWCRSCGALRRGGGRWRMPGRDSTPTD